MSVDREEAGLRGPVSTCSTETDRLSTTATYSLQGDLLELRQQDSDRMKWSVICRYDDHNRIIEKECVGNMVKGDRFFSYRYDSLGRLERVLVRVAKEGERVYESIQYAADGTKTSTLYPVALNPGRTGLTSITAESALHFSTDAVAIMTSFDASERPTRRVLYDVDDRVIRRVAFRYDERGLLIEEGEVIGGSIRDDFRNLYRYDAAGRRIQAELRCGDMGGTARRTYEYNEHGDMAQETIEGSAGIVVEPDASTCFTRRFAYQYDDQGNWIERKIETIATTTEPCLDIIERRTLTYF